MANTEVNGVVSNIHDQAMDIPVANYDRETIFVFGTAETGPIDTVVIPPDNGVKDIFGDVKNDASFETSLVRGFYEIDKATIMPAKVTLIRVGDQKNASVKFYTAQDDGSGNPIESKESFVIDSLEEGIDKNNIRTFITDDINVQGVKILNIELIDGTIASFKFKKDSTSPGISNSLYDLVSKINLNPELSGKVIAKYIPSKITENVTINGTNGSFSLPNTDGRLESIEKIITVGGDPDYIPAGSTTFELTNEIEKNANGGNFSNFKRIVTNEEITKVLPVLNQSLNTSTGIDSTDPLKFKLGCVDHGFIKASNEISEFRLSIKKPDGTIVECESYSDDTKDDIDGIFYKVDANGDLDLTNDVEISIIGQNIEYSSVIIVDYKYTIEYIEALTRQDIIFGEERSVFLFGNTLIFGSAQSYPVEVSYTSSDSLPLGYFQITDKQTGECLCINTDFYNKDITVEYNLTPELPSNSGTELLINSSISLQPGSMSGAKDSRNMSKKDYLKAVLKALKATEMYPRKQVLIMGLYLDDVETGPDENTGMPIDKPFTWYTDILNSVKKISNAVSECSLVIPVKPLSTFTQSAQNEWLIKLTENSDSDIGRAANIIDGIRNYRADAPVGVMEIAIPEVNSGIPYIANPGCIFAATKSEMDFSESITYKNIPPSINNVRLKIFDADIINKLNSKRYTAIIVNHRDQAIYADGPTLATKYVSQFDRQYVRDGVYQCVETARIVAEPFIGKPRKIQFLTKMRLSIIKALEAFVGDFLSDFSVEIIPTPDGHLTGETKIKLNLTTAKEIRQVSIETYIQLPADSI